MVKHRFTVEAYHKAYEAGALPERVELLEGEVYAVSPMGKKHRLYVMHLDKVFQEAFGDEAVVMVQCPLGLSTDSEPTPDLALLRPPLEAYRERDPGPGDTLLLVEISDTTLVQDRTLKLPLYQKAGIPEVWLVNLVEGVLEVYAFPHYAMERHPKGEAVAPRAFPTRPVAWWV
ncbi:Uma2 family endonuclease [Thermus sediminis]|uniref:Uma2 family endonuclease n=1 Tax=Thermus sediminis TaxID=1761908 RepID=UPI000E3D2B7B|nr:Uma2 family endonuclease [Thermus sediminis]